MPGCQIVACARSAEVFDRLERGLVSVAVIPIENSLAGSVTEHFDLLLARKVFIQRELRLRIVHNLIAAPGVKRGDLRRAYSHPVALEQCRDFFARNPKIQPTPFYDTAGSVKHVIESGLRDAAGIAGVQAAKAYGGKILAAGIEDDKRNFTRVADRKHNSGFYVNFIFEIAESAVNQLRQRLDLNDDVFRVLFTVASPPKEAPKPK